MCPITHESKLALLLAVIASFFFGAIWYGPLFGKKWAELVGLKMPGDGCKGKPPLRALGITLVGTIFMVFSLAYICSNYNPCCNFGAALWLWFALIPLLLSPIAWEKRPWNLFFINAGFYLLNLQLIAAVLTYVH